MEIKRQIVESKNPPDNKEVWWFDTSTEEIKRYTGGKWTSVVTSSGGNTPEPEPEPDLSLDLSTGSDKELWITINTNFLEDADAVSALLTSAINTISETGEADVEHESLNSNTDILKITYYDTVTPERVRTVFTTFITGLREEMEMEGKHMADVFYITLVLPSGIDTLVNGLIPTDSISDYDYNGLTIISDSIKSIESIFDGDTTETWDVSLILGMDTPPQIQTDSFEVAGTDGRVIIQIPYGTRERYLKDTNWEIIDSAYEIHELEEGITLEDVLESY